MITLLFTVSVLDLEPQLRAKLEPGALRVAKVLQQLIAQNLDVLDSEVRVDPPTLSTRCSPEPSQDSSAAEKPHSDFFTRLKASGRPTPEIAAKLVGLAITTAPLYSKAVAQIVDLYMSDERAVERAEITRLAHSKSGPGPETELLKGYVREAMSELTRSCSRDRY